MRIHELLLQMVIETEASQGISLSKKMTDELLNSRPGGQSRGDVSSAGSDPSDRGVNFTMFLTMMSERLFEFDMEAELLEAFESFDENDSGLVKVDEMRKWLSEVGERMDSYEVHGPVRWLRHALIPSRLDR